MDLARWERSGPSDLWDAFEDMRKDLDRALDSFQTPDSAGIFDRSTVPPVDVLETAEGYEIAVDVPGLDRQDLEVTVTGTLLALKGELRDEAEQGRRKFFRKETKVGAFKRTIDLPRDADTTRMTASLADGVLEVRVPKHEEARPRSVAIDVK